MNLQQAINYIEAQEAVPDSIFEASRTMKLFVLKMQIKIKCEEKSQITSNNDALLLLLIFTFIFSFIIIVDSLVDINHT